MYLYQDHNYPFIITSIISPHKSYSLQQPISSPAKECNDNSEKKKERKGEKKKKKKSLPLFIIQYRIARFCQRNDSITILIPCEQTLLAID